MTRRTRNTLTKTEHREHSRLIMTLAPEHFRIYRPQDGSPDHAAREIRGSTVYVYMIDAHPSEILAGQLPYRVDLIHDYEALSRFDDSRRALGTDEALEAARDFCRRAESSTALDLAEDADPAELDAIADALDY